MSSWDDLVASTNAMTPMERYQFALNHSGENGVEPEGINNQFITTSRDVGGNTVWEQAVNPNYVAPGPSGLASLFGGSMDAINLGGVPTTGWNQDLGYATMYGQLLNGRLPTEQIAGAPVYSSAGIQNGDVSQMDPALWTTMNAGNRGAFTQGVSAFLGGGWTPYEYTMRDNQWDQTADHSAQLFNLAKAVGFNTEGYNRSNIAVNRLYNDMNSYLKNYYGIAGLASGWNGNSDPLSAARTLYMDNGQGSLIPVSSNQNYRAQTTSELNRAQTGEMLTALSMALPAFGGVAGVLGSGSAGTLSAGSGLGLTNSLASTIGTGATNALVNAGANYALSGGQVNPIGSLLGSALSAGGNSVMGNSNGLGSMFDTSNAANMGSTYNSMTGLNQMLGTTGLSSSLGGIANAASALGGGGFNAQNMSQLGGSFLGQYLLSQLDPRLRQLGGQAGGSLASLFYR